MKRRPITLTCDGFTGMHYVRWDRQASAPSKVVLAYNAMLDVAGPGSAYRTRPGRYRISSSAIGGGGNGQLVYQFTKNDGTQYTVCICGGKFYTLNWGTGAWTEVLTSSDFSGASITLSSTARCYAVTFNNTLVVSDGTNTPWTWDGTTNGGLVKLTNAPVAYGQPTVYAGKLFFIKDTDRASIVWSEENAANTGYEASGYANVWALIQTGSEGIQAIRGTNEGLYFWRTSSIGVIRGAFNAEFATANTFDAVSSRIGTRSPRGVLYYNDTFYFPDQFGRPMALRPGGAAVNLWEQVALLYPQDADDDAALQVLGYDVAVSVNDLAAMQTTPLTGYGMVLYGHSPSNQSGDDLHGGAVYTADGVAVAVWFYAQSTAGVGAQAECLNSQTNLPEVVYCDDDGYTFALGKRGVWDDEQTDGTNVAIAVTLMGPRQFATNHVDLQFDRLDVVVDARNGHTTRVQAEVLTSRSPTTTSLQSQNVTTSLTVQQKHAAFGINRQGRWGHVYLLVDPNGTTNCAMTVHGWTLHAMPVMDSVGVP